MIILFLNYRLFLLTLKTVSAHMVSIYLEEIDSQYKFLVSKINILSEKIDQMNEKFDNLLQLGQTQLSVNQDINLQMEKLVTLVRDDGVLTIDSQAPVSLSGRIQDFERIAGQNPVVEEIDGTNSTCVPVTVDNNNVKSKKSYAESTASTHKTQAPSLPPQTSENAVLDSNICLQVIEPYHHFEKIFISRLHPDTSIDDIKHYILSRIKSNLSIKIFCCKTRYSSYSFVSLSWPIC